MNLKNKFTNDVYFIDLYEYWWHYALIGFTWFLPHKAYKINVRNNNKPKGFKFTIGMSLAMVNGFIINDLMQNFDFIKIPLEYQWFGKILACPFTVLLLVISWKFIKRIVKNGNRVNFERKYRIQLNIFSFNTLRKIFLRLAISFISIFLFASSTKYDLYGLILTLFLSTVVLLSTTFIAGDEIEIISVEGDILKTK